jgi:ATP-dependent helicase HepA
LVCDRSAEEGLNLQKRGASAIHFDLPLSPNRVEQRLGRLDRFGSGMPIQSVVLVCAGSRVQKCWFELLNDALGLFRRSIASLQYVIEEAMQNLWRDFIDTGVEGLEDSIAELGGDEGVATSILVNEVAEFASLAA